MSIPDPSLDRASLNPRLPRQVQAQVDRARKLETDRRTDDEPEPQGESASSEAQPAPPASASPPAPEPEKIRISKLDLAELINLSEYSSPDPSREQDPAYYKARFMVTDGIAKKLRGVNEENATLKKESERLRAENEQLKTRATPADAGARPESFDLSAFYTPQQIEEYGDDYLRANHVIIQDGINKHLDARLKPIEESVRAERQAKAEDAKAVAQQAQQEFLNRVTELLPEWTEIDADPRWHAWLKQKNSNRIVRQQALNLLSASKDVEGTVEMFKEFLAESGAVHRSAPPPMPPPTPPGDGGAPVSFLESPFPLTPMGYKQWKSLLARSAGRIYRGNADLTKKIEARYDAAVLQKLR